MTGYDYDFNESLGVWLTVTTQAYHRRMDERLTPHEITFRQAQVIGWLVLSGEMAQSDLAGKMLVEPSTVVRLLDRMEEAGFVQRVTVPADRRRHVVRLTDAAVPIWNKITVVARELRQEAAGDLTEEEQATLKKLLQKVSANLGAQDAATVRTASGRPGKKVTLHE